MQFQQNQPSFIQQSNVPANMINPLEQKPRKEKRSILKMLTNIKTIAVMIVVLQVIIIVLIINPINLYNQALNNQIINEVSKLAIVDPTQTPVIAVVSDADKLRGANAVQGAVYKDAKNGDYVLGYTNKLIIYRRAEGKVIYDGDNPNTVLDKAQKTAVASIISKAKAAGLLESSSEEQPQLSTVTDPELLKKQDATFYKDAQKDDIIAVFPQKGLIVIYRQNVDVIIKSGKYQTVIKQ